MNKKLVNLGCGNRFHSEWVNIDFSSQTKNVIAHNLLNGIPLKSDETDAVYHSHVLEHFSKKDGKIFIAECFRILKPGGIIRIAVPDLEQIAKHYLQYLNDASNGIENAEANYDWMMLELYDQFARNYSGGMMAEYLTQDKLTNEKFIYNRIGPEVKNIRKNFTDNKLRSKKEKLFSLAGSLFKLKKWKNFFYKIILMNDQKLLDIGRFRQSGEIHQWMYDRYSLKKLLTECGFVKFEIKTAFESNIHDWNRYQLDSAEGIVYAPSSIFVEAFKP